MRPKIIGMIHFKPLLKFSFDELLKDALEDLESLNMVDSVMIENNYDLPHEIKISSEAKEKMLSLGKAIRKKTTKPIGVCVLWNDYKAAINIANKINAQFVRIPVFVDEVQTDFGRIKGNSKAVVDYRNKVNPNIRLLTDIQVKHSKLLNKRPLIDAAIDAKNGGSDGIIITGNWTGDPPSSKDVEKIRLSIGSFPIYLGSGIDINNISEFNVDGTIISTSLKKGYDNPDQRNIKSYDCRIDKKKVKEFMKQVNLM